MNIFNRVKIVKKLNYVVNVIYDNTQCQWETIVNVKNV